MALFALSVVTVLLTFGKARRLSRWSLLTGASVSVACAPVIALAGTSLSLAAGLVAISAGAMVGIGWSRTNLLFVDGETVQARGNAWFLAVCPVSIMMPQSTSLGGGQTPYAAALVSLLGMGFAVCHSLGLLARRKHAGALAQASRSIEGERP